MLGRLEIRAFGEVGLAERESLNERRKMMISLLFRFLGIGCVDKNVIGGLSR